MPVGSRRSVRAPAGQLGAIYLLWLAAVAVFSAMASMVVTRWSDELRWEREQELLVVGDQMAAAIASYRRASPGTGLRYPAQLEDLLDDRRGFGTVRHLRRIQPDPVSRGAPWGLVRDRDGGILGVYSVSTAAPMRRVATRLDHVDLPPVTRYADWRFLPREDAR